MNKFAFNATSFVIKQLYHLSRAKVKVGGEENIPKGSIIFTINHFTRLETLILPYYIQKITKKPVWSLAFHGLFKGPLSDFLEKAGAVSTRDPNRDKLIINKLISGGADWVIFPEGGMIKSKKVVTEGDFRVRTADDRSHRPHTGAANFALRCEFYRQRLKWLRDNDEEEFLRLENMFDLPDKLQPELEDETFIVPVNLTYYPIRARENGINHLLGYLMDKVPEMVNEEIQTEGAMLLDGIDIDIRFGNAIRISDYLNEDDIKADIKSRTHYGFDDEIRCVDTLRTKSEQIMYRYMNGIYNMTTINHDHIFSYLLKNMPGEEIDPFDLKKRAYLAATLDIDPERLFLHNSLKMNQISLLTDDRFHKFSEFFDFCMEKGLIYEKDGKLFKNMEKFLLPEDTNDIRGVNPVAVFANEIEPLIVLGPHLERLAKEPAFNIDRRLIGHLSINPVKEFNEEIKKYSIDLSGVKVEENKGYPFLFQGSERKNGVVLLHGFLSSPGEMKEMGRFFSDNGFNVYSVRFPGHGTSIESLNETDFEEWISAAEEGLALMRLLSENVFVCGISLGAAVSFLLSTRLNFIKGVAAIAPPVKYVGKTDDGETWKSIFEKLKLKKNNSREDEPVYNRDRYSASTPKANKSLLKLSDLMFSNLYHVRTPSFVIQADKDPVVHPDSSKKAYDKIGCEEKYILNINSDDHSIINSDKKEFVFNQIKVFFEGLV